MDAILISTILILALLFLGMNVYSAFLFGSVAFCLIGGDWLGVIGSTIVYAIHNTSLLAIPLFMLGGGLLEITGLADKLIDLAYVLLKKVKNGMGATVPLASMFFGALCGSGTATCSVMGNLMIPKLERMGWDRRYTAALIAASGPLGYMIPPNMNAIIYGVIANSSISALFLASVIPGIIWGVGYMIVNRFIANKYIMSPEQTAEALEKYQSGVTVTDTLADTGSRVKDILITLKRAIPALLLPVIIMGGIYGGICTPTEAGAIACVYCLVLGLYLTRRITHKQAASEFVRTGMSLGGFFIIFPMVNLFARFMVLENVPQALVTFFTTISSNKYIILFLIDILLFIAGMFFDAAIFTLVLTPLLLPTATVLGIDPVHMGVIMFVAMGVGTITPPMAMNLFVVARVGKVSVSDMLKPLMPFLFIVAIPILLVVTYVPELSLWLPRLVLGYGG